MKLTTVTYRIKGQSNEKRLVKMGYAVNFVWNYCNEVNQESWKKFRKTYSNYDLHAKVSGCAKDLGIRSETLYSVCDHYVTARKQCKKTKLKWRSRKSLGWIPFKGTSVQVEGDSVRYNGRHFSVWKSRPIDSKVRCGSFNQDSKGRWFVNLLIEDTKLYPKVESKFCGVDLGLKTLVSLSDGLSFDRPNIIKKYEKKIGVAQKANKPKQLKNIHTKIKNQRKDWSNKVTTIITNEYSQIFIGNVSSSKLKKTKMAKSVSDASWYDFKRMLEYKAIRLGSVYKEVNESFSTVTCSVCNERSGPKGRIGLKVREWTCSCCGTSHLRDVNAAKNILRLGHQTLLKESAKAEDVNGVELVICDLL